MNVTELRDQLHDLKIDERCYRIIPDPSKSMYQDEQFVIIKEISGWYTFYFEHGNRNSLEYFKTEDEACRYFLNRLQSMPELR